MKKLGIILMLLLSCQAVWAQTHRQEERLNSRVETLTAKLDLSQEQQTQVRSILEENMEQMMALRAAGASSDSIKALRNEIRAKIGAILTEDQKKVFLAQPPRDPAKGFNGHGKGIHSGMMPDSVAEAYFQRMKAQRQAFDALLSDAERATIDAVRQSMKQMRPDSAALDSMSAADRLRHKADRLDRLSALDPIVAAHREALDSLAAPARPMYSPQGPGPHKPKGPKAQGNQRYYRFLLIPTEE